MTKTTTNDSGNAEDLNSKSLPRESLASTFDFGSAAEQYDAWYTSPKGMMYDRLEKDAVLRFLPSQNTEQMRLLDVGCGTGHWSRFFSDLGFEVTGIDCSEEMIRVARAKGIPNSRFEVADASEFAFEDGAFDIAVAVTSLEFSARPERMLGSMARCVRPGGSIIVAGLNGKAPLNQARKDKPPYSHARFLSPERLRCLLSPYGQPEIVTAAFVPWAAFLRWLAPFWDWFARGMQMKHGALVIGKVRN